MGRLADLTLGQALLGIVIIGGLIAVMIWNMRKHGD